MSDALEALQKAISALDELGRKIHSTDETLHSIEKFRDIHHVLIETSDLDNYLKNAILTKMRQLSRDLADKLFDGYGPLASFSAKIDIAYALKLFEHDCYDSLKKITKIRNKFAHSTKMLHFHHPEISTIIDSLPLVDQTITNKKYQFLKRVAEIKISFKMINEINEIKTISSESDT